MQIALASATPRNIGKDIAGVDFTPKPDAAGPKSPVTDDPPPVLPVWLTDTFAAQHATRLLKQVSHTPVGKVVQHVLDDPFVFLHQMRIGGLRESIASANASLAATLFPTRLGGTVMGAAVGALSGAGQAMMTFPGTSTVIVGAFHGLVVGAISGNVSVLESRHSRQMVIRAEDRLW